jgi:hypothetical protein
MSSEASAPPAPPAPPVDAAISTTPNDRRRPGRIDNVSPNLIPLLRPPPAQIDQDIDEDGDRPLVVVAPRQKLRLGVAVGAVLAIPLWILVVWEGMRWFQ